MDTQGRVKELRLLGTLRSAFIECEAGVVPSPGRYVLAHQQGSTAPLATALFAYDRAPTGFHAAPPIPPEWRPGSTLNLRGPLGIGFVLPANARRVGLVTMDDDPSRLGQLASMALQQGASVTLVCDSPPADLPLQLEIQPFRTLREVFAWSDYTAIDVKRDSLPALLRALDPQVAAGPRGIAQALVRTPMPCGGHAECGVCAVRTVAGPEWACMHGPVFALNSLVGET